VHLLVVFFVRLRGDNSLLQHEKFMQFFMQFRSLQNSEAVTARKQESLPLTWCANAKLSL